jgi:DNA-nicking Smr family endonuclease
VHRQKIETLKALRGKLPIEGDLKDLHRLEIKEAGSLHG